MASVAADTSAIAPPPPLPNRSDATALAGPAGAFSDLLDAAAVPPTAPQPQATAGTRTDDGSSAAQASGSAAGTSGGNAAASSGPANGKTPGRGKSTDDQNADDGRADSASAAVNVTVVAGLALPPFAFVPLPATDQTSAASQGTPTASSDSAAPTSDDTNGPSGDHKDAGASSDSILTALAAALPGLVTVGAVAAPVSSASAPTASGASVSPAATVAGVIATGQITGAPAVDSDEAKVVAPAAQQTDGTGQRNPGTSSAALDLLPTVPLPAAVPSAPDESQTATLPAITSAAPNSAAPDQNPQPAPIVQPIITADAPSGTGKPAAAAAALNPPTPLVSLAAESQVPAETAGNQSPPRDAGALQIALPAQVAVRFAATAHSDDDATSDSGTDVLGGASTGATAMAGSSTPPGAALAPSFTGILSTMQAAPGAMAAPQHAAVATDAVPVAAVPIAIVTRAEAGERKFEIRLDPPDLGRIEVQLNVDSSGRATSHLVVDRADTLDLLRRDAPFLERALQSAGLTTDNGSLQFSLRDQSFAGRDQGSPAPFTPPTPATSGESDVAPLDAAVRRYGPAAGLGGGIDIRV